LRLAAAEVVAQRGGKAGVTLGVGFGHEVSLIFTGPLGKPG
jgi:hypothetical protein